MQDVYVDKIIVVGVLVLWNKKEVQIIFEGKIWDVKVQYYVVEKEWVVFVVVGCVGVKIGEDWSIKVGV